MAGYSDTRQMIIDTLMGRPTGTEIQPEDHQAFALQITDYVRQVELVAGNATPISFADANTVPVQPDNGQAVYLSQINRGLTVTFTNFIDINGNPISITSDSSSVTFVTLLWNGEYWSYQTTVVTAETLTSETFRVVFTQNGTTITSSDSATAIKSAYDAGKYCYAVLGTNCYAIISSDATSAVFQDLNIDGITVDKFIVDTTSSVVKTSVATSSIVNKTLQIGGVDTDIKKVEEVNNTLQIGGVDTDIKKVAVVNETLQIADADTTIKSVSISQNTLNIGGVIVANDICRFVKIDGFHFNEISKIEQIQWSETTKRLIKYTSLSPEQYEILPLIKGTIYVYKNDIYLPNEELNDLILFLIQRVITINIWGVSSDFNVNDMQYIEGYSYLRNILSTDGYFRRIPLQYNTIYKYQNKIYISNSTCTTLVLWIDFELFTNQISDIYSKLFINNFDKQFLTDKNYLNSVKNKFLQNDGTILNETGSCITIIYLNNSSNLNIFKFDATRKINYLFVESVNEDGSYTPLPNQTVVSYYGKSSLYLSVPTNAGAFLITTKNASYDTMFDRIILDEKIIEGYKTVEENLNYISSTEGIRTKPSIEQSGYYISSPTMEIIANSQYKISPVISVSHGDIITFTCTTNLSIPASVITQCDSSGTLIKILALSNGIDNNKYTIWIEQDCYIKLCWNDNYDKILQILSIKFVQHLFELIQTKQDLTSFKTINDQSILGSGNLIISQGPIGPQGEQGPIGPQGNSGYQGTAGELEIINNIIDGGETSALSAEQGKNLGILCDYNNLPITPINKIPIEAKYFEIIPSNFLSNPSNIILSDYKLYNDFITRLQRQSIKIIHASTVSKSEIYHDFINPFDATFLYLKFGIHIPLELPVSSLENIMVWMSSGSEPLVQSNRCYYYIDIYSDDQHSRTGSFYGCLNLFRVGTKGVDFDITSVKYAGITVKLRNLTEDINYNLTDLSFVEPLKKPGICLIVDNFDYGVVQMANYAYSKGVKLNLSIIPNWIGNNGYPPISFIHAAKNQGHFIWNHTWNHVTTYQTEKQINEEFTKSDEWMMKHGFSRGSKVYSNPSSYYDNIRYKAQFSSNAQSIYHHWTTYPNGENSNTDKFLLSEPIFPTTRMCLNISSLDFNNPTDINTEYFIKLAKDALDYKGLAIMGFHGSFWSSNIDTTTLAGDRWKRFIDAIILQTDQCFYGIDDILEGRVY